MRPEVVSLSDQNDNSRFASLEDALFDSASKANEITILGGFFNAAWIVQLCKKLPKTHRASCRVRIAVGLTARILAPSVWEDMRCISKELKQCGFRKLEIGIVVPAPTHFHTKLFRFLHGTQPHWYIGSANPGSDRHELMVRFNGKHEALADYIKAVFGKATPVTTSPPTTKFQSLREFFLFGMLYHKSPPQSLFTFEAFKIHPSDRSKLMAALAAGQNLEHAQPRTEGFGFDLISALGGAIKAREDEKQASRVQLRPFCIETVYGYWMPRVYIGDINAKVEIIENQRRTRFTKYGRAIASPEGRTKIQKKHSGRIQIP